MSSQTGENLSEEIRQVLRSINDAWIRGRLEELGQYFHEDMVITDHGFQGGGSGREACVQSYKDFVSQATIHMVKESEHVIHVWGDTALATYAFEMEYEMNGKNYHDTGRDLFVFTRTGKTWQAVWRTIIPVTEKE